MNRSESITSLAKALAIAQGLFGPLKKSKTAQIAGKDGRAGYSYSYAELADVINVYRKPLADNGLSLLQPVGPHVEDPSQLTLTTLLLHESGEWLSETFDMPKMSGPQAQGTLISYARRYQAQALLGLASEDDDGAAAQEQLGDGPAKAAPKPRQQAKTAPAPKAPPATSSQPGGPAVRPVLGAEGPLVDMEQRGVLNALARDAKLIFGRDAGLFTEFIVANIGGTPPKSTADLTVAQFVILKAALEKKIFGTTEEAAVPDEDPTNGDDTAGMGDDEARGK